jgi:hypothetical protein
MKRIVVTLAMLAVCAPVALGQYKEMMGVGGTSRASSTVPKVTLKGYLIDKTCIATHASGLDAFAHNHSTACTVKFMNSGVGVVSDDTWFPFDEKGAKKAADLLKDAKATRGLLVQVTGNMKGGVFVVSSLKEIKP